MLCIKWLTYRLEEERLTYMAGRGKVDLPAGKGKGDLPGWKTSYCSFVTTSETNDGSALAKKGTDATSALQL